MKINKENFHETASHYMDILINVGNGLKSQIKERLSQMGGKVCVAHYTQNEPNLDRYVFFQLDDDGYGLELFITQVNTENGEPEFVLQDSEQTCEVTRSLNEFSTSELLYVLEQLEDIMQYAADEDEDIVAEWQEE